MNGLSGVNANGARQGLLRGNEQKFVDKDTKTSVVLSQVMAPQSPSLASVQISIMNGLPGVNAASARQCFLRCNEQKCVKKETKSSVASCQV